MRWISCLLLRLELLLSKILKHACKVAMNLEALQSFEQAPAELLSGDVQPKAIQRGKNMGANPSIKKPASSEEFTQSVVVFGLMTDGDKGK